MHAWSAGGEGGIKNHTHFSKLESRLLKLLNQREQTQEWSVGKIVSQVSIFSDSMHCWHLIFIVSTQMSFFYED